MHQASDYDVKSNQANNNWPRQCHSKHSTSSKNSDDTSLPLHARYKNQVFNLSSLLVIMKVMIMTMTMIMKIMMFTLMTPIKMMMMTMMGMRMIKCDKNENESNNVLESEKNCFSTFAKDIFHPNIQYKTTNNSRYEYSDCITNSVPLSKQIIQEENILLFLFHHIHQTF